MIKSNKRIEIVRSETRGLSSMSHASAVAARAVLAKRYASVRITIVNNLDDLEAIASRNPNLIFLGMEYILLQEVASLQPPEKLWLADYFDEHDIAYTGSGSTAHELQRNKSLAKQCVVEAGLQSAAYCVIRQNETPSSRNIPLTFPVFIKPISGGGGQGVDSRSLAYTFDELVSKVHSIAARLHSDSLVEEYLPGREFSVAILKDEYSSEYVSMPIELIAPLDQNGVRMLSGAVKSADAEQAVPVTDLALKTTVSELALAVFLALGARDYGRIDIRLDAHGVPHFLEANLIPSLIEGYGSFPKACLLNMDLGYEAMMLSIAELGLARTSATYEATAGLALLAEPGLSLSAGV
jgi:D-alanine-D-alanine ligase